LSESFIPIASIRPYERQDLGKYESLKLGLSILTQSKMVSAQCLEEFNL